jgi:DNA-directed RNA polymerase subunit M/transcription elongation factor TFIIS
VNDELKDNKMSSSVTVDALCDALDTGADSEIEPRPLEKAQALWTAWTAAMPNATNTDWTAFVAFVAQHRSSANVLREFQESRTAPVAMQIDSGGGSDHKRTEAEDEEEERPTNDYRCATCGHRDGRITTKQIRRGDEARTVFWKCDHEGCKKRGVVIQR